MSRVLVVDDDPALRRTLQTHLTAHGHTVVAAGDGAAALRAATEVSGLEVVLLDLELPDLSGLEVLAGLRRASTLPVIALSGTADPDQVVLALDAGADDYLSKPFPMPELLARLRAALRRAAAPDTSVISSSVISTEHFTIDMFAGTVTRDGAGIHLSATEWGVLAHLVAHPGKLITQHQLFEAVWGPNARYDTHYLRVYLAHLRRKLEPDPTHPRYLITETGRGYRFEPAGPPTTPSC